MPLPKVPGYWIERLAGRGGFGSVYEGRDRDTHTRVAIKIVRPNDEFALRRLWYEALALRAIGPPFVPAIYKKGTLDTGHAYVVMEWLAEPTLAHVIAERRNGMTCGEFASLAPAIARALGEVHRRGFIHRDLKPDHIVIKAGTTPPGIRLLDLGLVKPLHALEPKKIRVGRGTAVGTPGYMSPEQSRGAPVGVASDIWALGAVMYEMLTGQRAFNDSDGHGDWIAPQPSVLVAVSPFVERVVARCLARRPSDRYQSVVSLRGALTRALGRACEKQRSR